NAVYRVSSFRFLSPVESFADLNKRLQSYVTLRTGNRMRAKPGQLEKRRKAGYRLRRQRQLGQSRPHKLDWGLPRPTRQRDSRERPLEIAIYPEDGVARV